MTDAAGSSLLAAHPPISLAELAALAALQTRVDRKYILTRPELDTVLADLDPAVAQPAASPAARVLQIDGRRAFGYESVYFDTADLAAFERAAHPRRRRFKIRTRSYLDSGECYLEVKTRGGRDITVKDRLPYGIDDRDQLTPAGRRYVREVLADAGIAGIDPALLEPVLVTRYHRTTLYLPGSGSRATIDTDLSWVLDERRGIDLADEAIVETKSAGAASEIDRMLWGHGHRPVGISKFGTGLAALRPELPSNKWARVLRRHFIPSLPSDLRTAS